MANTEQLEFEFMQQERVSALLPDHASYKDGKVKIEKYVTSRELRSIAYYLDRVNQKGVCK